MPDSCNVDSTAPLLRVVVSTCLRCGALNRLGSRCGCGCVTVWCPACKRKRDTDVCLCGVRCLTEIEIDP